VVASVKLPKKHVLLSDSVVFFEQSHTAGQASSGTILPLLLAVAALQPAAVPLRTTRPTFPLRVRASMAWQCSGATNAALISNLQSAPPAHPARTRATAYAHTHARMHVLTHIQRQALQAVRGS